MHIVQNLNFLFLCRGGRGFLLFSLFFFVLCFSVCCQVSFFFFFFSFFSLRLSALFSSNLWKKRFPLSGLFQGVSASSTGGAGALRFER